MWKLFKLVYPVAVIILFIGFIAGFKHEDTLTQEESREIDRLLKAKAVAEETDAADSGEDQATEPVLTALSTEKNTVRFSYSQFEKAVVTLQSDDELWFEIIDAATEEQIDEGLWSEGEQKEWDLTDYEEVYFQLGNPAAADLKINEEPLSNDEAGYVYIQFGDEEVDDGELAASH
ncbi:RodZ domain-containing protein [Salipaludibacillus aurantiacus]|uniref:Cytoskeleton protein RodZ-like C-terminal domain-containing protein n=1 Tax=Salipaludibacillus aurantiacus TaxID=1601833 RepID=A0A1H9X5A7_9BACI|nr:RodZ domain-containing protein [Salipaludibacillus aurantiacus]SES41332.1 hypothetical protein SAMN05518684_12528 [Salipaludibacillus aurantiacus]